MPLTPSRVVAELRELQELTGDENGAQRVAWTETWETRARLAARQGRLDRRRRGDRRGRQPVVHARAASRIARFSSAATSTPSRTAAGSTAASTSSPRSRCCAASPRRARRRSPCASSTGPTRRARASAARSSAPPLRPARWRIRTSCGSGRDADGIALPDALAEHGVDLDRALDARSQLANAAAYLELHIEQGPVLESLDLPLGVVLGTFGVERHLDHVARPGGARRLDADGPAPRRARRRGQARARAPRRSRAEVGDGAVCTSGGVVCKPGIVTSVVETAEQLLDQRHLDAGEARAAARAAQDASERFAREENIDVEWSGSGASSRSRSTRA